MATLERLADSFKNADVAHSFDDGVLVGGRFET